MFETIKIIENLGAWKPKVVIWENVKNVLSKKMVSAFSHYLNDMEDLGYAKSYQVLDARDFGIPRARERLFTVSLLSGEHFDFSKMTKKPMRPIEEFLETDVNEKYIVTQPSMICKLPGKPILPGNYGGRMLEKAKTLFIQLPRNKCVAQTVA
jgi:DNA (cytosine-5)-methyltransferase 1